YDLTFSTPTTQFSNFLGLVPSAYAGSLENIKTTGEFSVKGAVKGALTETTIPTLDIVMASDNASFKYPDLPKAVENILLDVKIKNETGLTKDTYVDLDKLSFRIDQDVFNAKAKISNLTENMLVDAKMDGTINLANLSKAYPIDLQKDLSGIIKANLELSKLNMKTGKSDVQVNGTLDNVYGFMFKDQVLKGNFNLSSNHLEVSDFMTSAPEETKPEEAEKVAQTTSEPVKIPAFLDCT